MPPHGGSSPPSAPLPPPAHHSSPPPNSPTTATTPTNRAQRPGPRTTRFTDARRPAAPCPTSARSRAVVTSDSMWIRGSSPTRPVSHAVALPMPPSDGRPLSHQSTLGGTQNCIIDLRSRRSALRISRAACAPFGQSVQTSSLVGGGRSDLEGAARGELAPMVLVVLGRVVVNVGDGHDVLEVGIPADREVHRESECVLGLPGKAAA